MTALGASSYPSGGLPFQPVVDGTVAPAAAARRDRSGERGRACTCSSAPTGTRSTLFNLMDPALADHRPDGESPLARARGSAAMRRRSSSTTTAARRPDAVGLDLWTDVGTDAMFRIPAISLAETQQAHGPVWMYLFTWETPAFGGVLRSTHALEIPFVFDNARRKARRCSPANGADRQAIADAMHGAWIALRADRRPEPRRHPRLARIRRRPPRDDALRRRRSRCSTTRWATTARPGATGAAELARIGMPASKRWPLPGPRYGARTGARPSRARSCGCRPPTSTRRGQSCGGPPTAGARSNGRRCSSRRCRRRARPRMRSARARSRGEDGRTEPVVGVVHPRDRFVVAVDLRDADDGPERLVAHERHAVVDVDDDRRLEPVPGPLDAVAAGEDACAALHRVGELRARARRVARRARAGRCRWLVGRRSPTRVALHDFDERVDEPVPDRRRARRPARSRCTTGPCCRTRLRRRRARRPRRRRRRTTYAASLPPSSSCTRTIRSAAARSTRWPVACEPVKHTMSTSLSTSAAPVAPRTDDGLHHVDGHAGPVRCRSTSRSPVSVACSDGLYSTALPVSSAGTIVLRPTKYG